MKSRQVRYDLDLAGYGIPGLNFMTRYITGSEANDQHWRAGQHYAGGALSSYGAYDGAKWHELNLELRYVVQQGPIRDLSIRTRMANYRGNQQAQVDLPDINEVRVIVEYPLKF
ncbi:TPA: OprD family outer membrane porin [Pseudomonas putida]|nr:OprD family outer membrane porin [Pseudomonas putida]